MYRLLLKLKVLERETMETYSTVILGLIIMRGYLRMKNRIKF